MARVRDERWVIWLIHQNFTNYRQQTWQPGTLRVLAACLYLSTNSILELTLSSIINKKNYHKKMLYKIKTGLRITYGAMSACKENCVGASRFQVSWWYVYIFCYKVFASISYHHVPHLSRVKFEWHVWLTTSLKLSLSKAISSRSIAP